ncbi:MAG: hypothetical protein KAT34_22185 [Candidatus Aminicenantes bacterium]|nr:hypothetical protein [Candidatus Aminicenantes bacterium]
MKIITFKRSRFSNVFIVFSVLVGITFLSFFILYEISSAAPMPPIKIPEIGENNLPFF